MKTKNLKAKDLKLHDTFTFINNGELMDGELLQKERTGYGQYNLLIKVENGLLRKKSKELNLYCVYENKKRVCK